MHWDNSQNISLPLNPRPVFPNIYLIFLWVASIDHNLTCLKVNLQNLQYASSSSQHSSPILPLLRPKALDPWLLTPLFSHPMSDLLTNLVSQLSTFFQNIKTTSTITITVQDTIILPPGLFPNCSYGFALISLWSISSTKQKFSFKNISDYAIPLFKLSEGFTFYSE